ncbi:MAG: type I DNA topoisomerase [Clostridia bacterium]|nr:type I DNA topoisomerase [Clostridia bacterium]
MAAKSKTLVIVESPSKAKTISKYLGSSYEVIASVGHIRDLPKSKLGVNIENDFEPEYIPIRGKGDLIKEIKKKAKQAGKVYLATDPDREGEAISWHLAYLLGIDINSPCRVTFNEITKNTVKEAIKHPRGIDISLVDAQQARRVLDRLVGYQISPILWRKVRKGLSAGRVQSATLKMICDRENEITSFVPREYWNVVATFKKGQKFDAKLMEHKGKKVSIENQAQCEDILKVLRTGDNLVKEVSTKTRTKKPFPPFTTSSLQQDASNKLNFATKKTMMIAQQLYEGVDIKGHGTVGLVTYIRTDSVRISEEAKAKAKAYIEENFGKEYVGNNFFSNKKKDIQDAHEAIRPSDISLEPKKIEQNLTKDQFKLYQLIYNRFMASNMAPATYDSMSVDIQNGDYTYRANGQKMTFDGFLKIYNASSDEDKDKILPKLEKEDKLELLSVDGEQNFTQPPSRFTEASLIKELEDKEIGRPSTYAPIVITLTERKYIKKEKKSLLPTELGFVVNDLMNAYFKDIVDAGFTAYMENQLDDVELSKANWKTIVREFYGPFEKELKVADSEIERVKVEDQLTGEICEICGKPMALKTGRFGDFIACTGYPQCKNTKPIVKELDVKCPQCGNNIIARKSKKGKTFYGCSGYPNCNQVFWYKPVNEKCPKCGSLLVSHKGLTCSNPDCEFKK